MNIIAILKRDHSLHKVVDGLYYLKIIKLDDYNNLNKIIEKDISITSIFTYFKYDQQFIDLMNFYLHYYPNYQAIEKALEYRENIKKYQKEISSSLAYPLFLIISSIIVVIFIVNTIIPQILMITTTTSSQFDNILLFVKILPSILSLILIVCLLYFILIQYLYHKKVEIIFNNKYLFGYNRIFKYQCSLLFSLYVKEVIKNSNISSNSIILLNKQSNNKIIKYISDDIIKQLNKGLHLFDIIESLDYFTNEFKYHFILSENSKHLSIILEDYYNQTLISIKEKTKLVIAIVLPIIICLIGFIIILMYYLIMYPALNMSI